MDKIALFCEDSGHEAVIMAMILKLAPKGSVQVLPRSSRHGKGRALSELEKYLKDLERGRTIRPDAIVAAIDANCKGYNNKRNEINEKIPGNLKGIPFVYAIPDPHIERWLLVDSHAFKQVFGKGVRRLTRNVRKTGIKPSYVKLSGTPG